MFDENSSAELFIIGESGGNSSLLLMAESGAWVGVGVGDSGELIAKLGTFGGTESHDGNRPLRVRWCEGVIVDLTGVGTMAAELVADAGESVDGPVDCACAADTRRFEVCCWEYIMAASLRAWLLIHESFVFDCNFHATSNTRT